MIKSYLLILTLLGCLAGHGQGASDSSSSKLSTQKFVSETLNKFSFNDESDGTNNKYIVSFNDSLMFILNLQNRKKYYTTLKVRDIDTVIVLEKQHNIWLTLQLKSGKRESTLVDATPLEDTFGMYEFLLSKSFGENGLPEKTKKALFDLIKFYK